ETQQKRPGGQSSGPSQLMRGPRQSCTSWAHADPRSDVLAQHTNGLMHSTLPQEIWSGGAAPLNGSRHGDARSLSTVAMSVAATSPPSCVSGSGARLQPVKNNATHETVHSVRIYDRECPLARTRSISNVGRARLRLSRAQDARSRPLDVLIDRSTD